MLRLTDVTWERMREHFPERGMVSSKALNTSRIQRLQFSKPSAGC